MKTSSALTIIYLNSICCFHSTTISVLPEYNRSSIYSYFEHLKYWASFWNAMQQHITKFYLLVLPKWQHQHHFKSIKFIKIKSLEVILFFSISSWLKMKHFISYPSICTKNVSWIMWGAYNMSNVWETIFNNFKEIVYNET